MKGHVYKRGKTFTYLFDGLPDPLSGQRKQVSKGGWETEKEAWAECRKAIALLETGRHVKPSRRTLGGFLQTEWLPAIKSSIAETTWGNWEVLANSYVVPTIGKANLQALTAPQLQAFYDHLLTSGRIKKDLTSVMFLLWRKGVDGSKQLPARRIAEEAGVKVATVHKNLRRFRAGYIPEAKSPGLEAKTVRNVHTMLHTALASAVNWRYVAEHAKPPKVRRRKPTVWTAAQMRKFLKSIRDDRFYALFLLGATTGFRRGELCGVRWPAIDLQAGTMSVEPDTLVVVNGKPATSDGKSDNAPRLLSLDKATTAALREWQAVQNSERAFFERDYQGGDRVFTWENGRDVHPDVIRQRFNRLSERCGLPHIRLYDVRHTYATTALKSGVHPKIVSTRLGHASVGFTLTVYSHALPGMDREAAQDIANMYVDEPEEDDVSNSVSNDKETPDQNDL